ncbi:MAG: ABC-2 type transport system ATP-binding protein [Crocinitomicaceae bacterium]|jgi:ABC-type multidrug transport system ATPase subunit
MVYGLLGPNGSGKTTTLGMLLGVIRPTEGDFSWFGNGQEDVNRMKIGALLETPNFYPYLTAEQNLELVAKIKGIDLNPESIDTNSKSIDDILELVGLSDRRNSKFSTYSLGMKQRLAIGSALIGNPEVLVLDEPTNGLDPQGIAEIRDLIIEIGKTDKTIIIASHILDEIEKVCTHCAILRKGELLQTGTIKDIIGNQDVTLIKLAANDIDTLRKAINQIDKVSIYKEVGNEIIIRTESGTKTSDINQLFFDKGIVLSALNMFNESLENQFLEIVGKS